jgi:RNA polymerase sigma factor (sigma-70 family)
MDSLDELMERLTSGDEASAARAFRAYEPYLRLVVRRMLSPRLRSKFDSIDVVQSVWADVLAGFRDADWRFASAAHLRAFLVKATRNRFVDRLRQQRVPLDHQRPLTEADLDHADQGADADPSDVAQAEELWQQMLALCPPEHRQLLELKRQGCTLNQIADRTHFHPSSIRRIFYDLARRLAVESV